MRKPSIHITKELLAFFIDSYFKDSNPGIDTDDLVNYIAKNGNRFQLTSRKKLALSEKAKKAVELSGHSVKADTQLFAQLLISLRRAKKHKGISIIREGTKDWNTLKLVTELATEFCTDFELPLRRGYIEYINLAFEVLPSFNLNQINFKHSYITDLYIIKNEITQDPHKELTQKLLDWYSGIVSAKIGISYEYSKDPFKYVYFVRAAKLIQDNHYKPYQFIYAQFISLSWIKGLPEPNQLVTEKAIQRYIKYQFSNNNKVKETPARDINKLKAEIFDSHGED